ncbi:TonB-dependent receptor plug domain-containing protein [Flavobacterium sp. NRK1]|uniref:TonB-dependent receptor n=1 Tax=Flavobacterium sp. NRK1 TaxID=2954929 RepID=UPI002092FE31|nr:TonB-dependent receptor plug domain-containing protein [Flavobacterium sp. NRK1]MCO6148490.1 TonB-dependent receptor [Flavobacterium sp. NRK1]
MKTINKLFTVLLILAGTATFAQNKALIYGVLLDESRQPAEGVTVKYDDNKGNTGETVSDKTGFYTLEIPAGKEVILYYLHVSYVPASVPVTLPANKKGEINAVLIAASRQLEGVTITGETSRQRVQGLTKISREVIKNIPGANPGVENIIKLLGGNSNNEMSTQYSVRGGNYDENLVYVEDIEIYRPFLIRSGQQEGLSFTNTAMVENVEFSAGGFQAKYGDKMSSVLDVTYRRPVRNGLKAEASFLGGSITADGISKNQKWSGIVGARYRDNSLLVNSQQTKTNYKPTFTDVQAMLNFTPNAKWELSFLGNISQNKYNYQPLTRQTNFGTIDDPIALQIFYDGQEKDQYTTYFGAFKSTYTVSENFQFKVIGSLYHTQEQEHFDILAQYNLGEVDTNIGSDTFGDIKFARAVGSQLNHGRNDLDALIANVEVKGYHIIKRDRLEWGAKYTREDIRDRLMEWEVIDSAGFSLRPPVVDIVNDQPYNPFTGDLVPYNNIRSTNFVQINRFSGFVQWSHRTKIGEADLFMNAGVRAHSWKVTGDVEGKAQTIVSPRGQLTLKPAWQMDMLFRLSGGLYSQPPFYRELRDSLGQVRPNVKAQKSIHVVLGNDYSFRMWSRPFKLVSEAYYKKMDDVNTYTIENVRIRYRANNDAVAYAYGLDLRMNGEFVPGTESWLSFGYMKTEENINDRGYIARPTDQRLKFGILFQDYVPNIPNLKVYLNMVYNTGLPGGSPSYADSYKYQSRLNDYRRVDAGFAYVFTDSKTVYPKGHWLSPFRELSLGLEIFNLFNNQNSITNTWVRDVYTKSQYGIPNYLTSRVFSLKLNVSI